jgi:hypothetical protein
MVPVPDLIGTGTMIRRVPVPMEEPAQRDRRHCRQSTARAVRSRDDVTRPIGYTSTSSRRMQGECKSTYDGVSGGSTICMHATVKMSNGRGDLLS